MENKTRREFLKNSAQMIGVGVCSSVVATMLNSCEEFIQKESNTQNVTINLNITTLSGNDQSFLSKQGMGILKSFGKYNYGIPLIILRLTDPKTIPPENTKFAAFSSMCTHDHCMIHNPDSELPSGYFTSPGLISYRYIHCNCHGSSYDPFEHAKIIQGPAEKPLKEFPVEYDYVNNILKITF